MTQKLKMLFCVITNFSIFILENDTKIKKCYFVMTQIFF